MTSTGNIPFSRLGTINTSISIPPSPLVAVSQQAEVRPAAPRSCNPTIDPVSSSSRQASSSNFSIKGSPTCTADFFSSDSPVSSTEAKLAPPMPSLPVAAPTYITELPTPEAFPLKILSCSIKPTHMALTSGFPL